MSMLTRKTESSNCCARSALSPSATTIATIAISSGTSPATTAPKTSRRMMSAAGSPNLSSPFSRSSWERRLKSWSSVSVARHRDGERALLVDALRPSRRAPPSRRRRRARSGRSSRGDPPRRARRSRRRGTCSRGRERVISPSSTKLAHVRLELRRVDRVLLGADDDDVADGGRRIRRERREPNVVGALRLGVVRRRALGREAPTEERRDREPPRAP